ncbi:MAG: hypothetical protein SO164_07265 [Campylobacter sp.]|nr:hypothetical protein [Campylobacter sp.]
MKKTSFKSLARFFKLYSEFLIFITKMKKSTPSVRLKENALLKI